MSSSEFLAVVRLAVKGAQSARKDIETFRKSIMETGKAAGLSKKEMDQLDKTIAKGSASQRQATQASKQSADGKKRESAEAKKLREEMERLNNQYKRTQQQLLSKGGDPSAAIGRFSQEELKRIVALNQVYPQYGKEVAKAAREALRLADAKQKVNKNMKDTEGGTKGFGSSLPRLRYALYDVSQTAALMGAALAGIGGAVLKTAVDFERSFAEVIRTTGVTGDEIEKLRSQFEDLNTELPVSFQELARVGKLAGQLGIPTQDIQDFTRLVVQFSETTGIAVEDAATAFGRLSALLNLSGDQFENLGSAILKVGTSFVATEAEIVAISTQLAGVGRQAGLTADQVVGLSAALASVGIAPELARGVITRTFGRIGQAVTAGGTRLTDFAKIAGMSSDEFAAAWRDDAAGAFLSFTQGLQARGGEAEAALAALGITSIRDVPALLRLAQTSESILAPALATAAEGFEEGTELADQYGIIAGTTAEQLNRLKQNVQQLFAELAKGILVFSPAIEAISAIVKGLREFAKIPIVGFLSSAVLGATALAGVFLIAFGATIRFSASLLAVRTSLTELNAVANGQRVTLMNLVTASFRAATGNQKLAASNVQLSAATKQTNILLAAKAKWLVMVSAGQTRLAATSRVAAVGVLNLVAALKTKIAALGALSSVMRAVPWLLAIDLLFKFANSFEVMKRASQDAAESLRNYVEGLTDFENATEAAAGQIDILSDALRESMGWGSQFLFWVGELFGIERKWWAVEELARGGTTAKAFGESLQDLVEQGEAVKASEIFLAMIDELEQAGFNAEDFIETVLEINPAFEDAANGVNGATDALAEMDEQTQQNIFNAMDLADQIALLRDEMVALIDDIYGAVNAEREMENALIDLGEAFANNTADVEANGLKLQNVIKLIIDQAAGDIPTAIANMEALYDTLISNGMAYEGQLINLRMAIDALIASSTQPLPAVRTATIDTTALARSFSVTRAASADTAKSTGRTASNTRQAAKAAERQAKATKETQKQVRTLIDYARDLAAVFSRAFDLRFKAQADLDKIADTWDGIAESIEDAENRIAELTRTQSKLASDRAIKEYFLSIADAYGDTLRSDALRAELSDIDADIADNTKEIAQAQNEASRELDGNSQAARANRATITGLVSQYQSYIASLAESGMKQDELRRETEKAKNEFTAQARALGFAEKDIQSYAAAFDDVTFAINNVPRNVTIEANVNPAITALKELEAQQNRNIQRANDLNRAMNQPVSAPSPGPSSPGTSSPSPSTGTQLTRAQIQQEINQLQNSLRVLQQERQALIVRMNSTSPAFRGDIQRQINSVDQRIRNVNNNIQDARNRIARLATGGLVGGPGGKKSDSVPAMLSRGEYVVRASAVDKYGVDFFNSINQMRMPQAFGGSSTTIVNTPNSMTVELSSYDRKLLADAGNIELRLDGRVLANNMNAKSLNASQRGTN